MTSYLLWCDVEATDKDPTRARIMELALIATTVNLQILARFHAVIHFDSIQLDSIIAEWSKSTHTQSGLVNECYASKTSIRDVERKAIEFIRPYVEPCHAGENLILAGSSIAFDMSCLRREMPEFASFLHYRTLDVNSWLLPIAWWLPSWHVSRPVQTLPKRHRAQPDIEDSLKLMKHYHKCIQPPGMSQTVARRPDGGYHVHHHVHAHLPSPTLSTSKGSYADCLKSHEEEGVC